MGVLSSVNPHVIYSKRVFESIHFENIKMFWIRKYPEESESVVKRAYPYHINISNITNTRLNVKGVRLNSGQEFRGYV